MATPASELFGEADLERINQGLERLDQARQILDLAKQAGLDVAEQEQRAKDSREQLLRLKNTFFPGR